MPTNVQQLRRTYIDDRYDRAGHPFDGMPSGALDNISSLSGYQYYSNDFIRYEGPNTGVAATTGGWLCGDTGTAVIAGATGADGYGELSIASGGTENNCTVLQLVGESFKYVSGSRMWCFARLKLDDIDDNEAFWGLAAASAVTVDTTAEFLAINDGLYFEKAETASAFDFHARKNDVSTEVELVSTLSADDTYRILGFVVESSGAIRIYDGLTIATLVEVGSVGAGNAGIPDDVELSLYFGVEAGDAAAGTLTVDWVVVAQER